MPFYLYRRSAIENTSRMSSIAPHILDTHVIPNSSFCITSDLLAQQKTRARIVFLFSDCHKFSILFLKQRRLSTRTITRGLVIVTAISETWFTTYQVFTEEEQKKKYISGIWQASEPESIRQNIVSEADWCRIYIYMKIKAQILACADPLDFITLNEKNMLDDF